jgi:glycosyltransferase involved in cell wall biosynthesis
VLEVVRSIARRCGERDPLVLAAARRSTLALAVTEETACRLRVIGARYVEILSQLGLSEVERSNLEALAAPPVADPVRFLSLGNLLYWKGFHLGLRAFAAADLPGSEYWLVGDGRYRARLQRLVRQLGLENKVRFWGALPRADALAKLGSCHVVVHPSLHDSGGWVCMEAMAAGKPVICLDLGGPGAQVTPDTGFKIRATNRRQVVDEIARAMTVLAGDPRLRAGMGRAGKDRVAAAYAWERKGELVSALYHRLAAVNQCRAMG